MTFSITSFGPEEVQIVVPLYDVETGGFKSLRETVGFMSIRGDADKTFFNYVFSKKNSKVVYAFQIRRILNTFTGTLFNRHKNQLLDKKFERDSFFSLLFFLPATTNRKEEINRFKRNGMLHHFNISLDRGLRC